MTKEEIELIKEVVQDVTKLPVNPEWSVADSIAFNKKLHLSVDIINKYTDLNKPKQIEDKTMPLRKSKPSRKKKNA